VGFVISVAAWNYVTALIQQNQTLGFVVLGLLAAFLLVCLLIAAKEIRALLRLSRVDHMQTAAARAWAEQDLPAARKVVQDLAAMYRRRDDAQWGLAKLAQAQDDVFDADGLLGAAETSVLSPLDQAAVHRIESASRQVAMVTALVPIALADVITALTANLRMIRGIAEIYGGRGGTLGSLRLTRSVLTHLVATGAVAVGDDLIGSVAGGGILAKFSRRFGEGVINGALTARVGVAAIEVCRPLPFHVTKPPSVTAIIGRSLTGLWTTGSKF
ncbi:MAG: TIGR01620 family protein, partial [Pseudomonadota bacterium]